MNCPSPIGTHRHCFRVRLPAAGRVRAAMERSVVRWIGERPSAIVRFVPVSGVLLAGLLAGCDRPGFPLNADGGIGGGVGNTNQATLTACTESADRVYNRRNRAEIYAPNSSVNAPFSANYSPGSTDRGLSDRYAYDSMIRDCVRNTGTETNRAVPPPPGSGPVVRP